MHHECLHFFFFKQKTAYEMRISDWSSDVCSSDLVALFDVKQSYLENLIEARTALPYGAREFFASRLKRLEELSSLLVDGPEADGTAGTLLEHMRKMQIGRAACRERVCQYV